MAFIGSSGYSADLLPEIPENISCRTGFVLTPIVADNSLLQMFLCQLISHKKNKSQISISAFFTQCLVDLV